MTSSISKNLALTALCVWVTAAVATDARAAAPAQTAAAVPTAKAQALIRRGEVAFVQERFEDALTAYEQAYETTQAHGLIFMLARCHEELGHVTRAIGLYQRFLSTDPPDTLRGKAETALRLLRQRLDRGTLVVQVSPFGAAVFLDGSKVGTAPIGPLTVKPGRHEVRVEDPGRPPRSKIVSVPGGRQVTLAISLDGSRPPPDRTWPWATGGVGLALVAGGAIAFVLGDADHREVDASAGSLTQREAARLIDRGDDKKVAGTALLAVGGAALVVSGVLFALAPSRGEPSLAVSPALGGAVVVTGGSF